MDKIEIFKKIDKVVGTPLCILLSISNIFRDKTIARPRRILIIKLVAIGDLVVILPTIKAIRNIFPEAWIGLMTTLRVKEIVEGCPFINEIIYYDIFGKHKGITGLMKFICALREKHIDTIIDMEHYYRITSIISYFIFPRNWLGFDLPYQGRKYLFSVKVPYHIDKHEVEAFFEFAKTLGVDTTKPELVEIWTSEKDKKYVDIFFEKNNINPTDELVIGIHPGTGMSAISRRWLPERFAILGDWLISEYNAKIIFTGAASEVELVNSIVTLMKYKPVIATGKTTLKQLAEIGKRCKFFISVDTGPLHVVAAMKTPVIGLYGPNTPLKWGPYGKGHITIYKALSCSPCTKQYLGQVSKCKHPICMEQITVEDVRQAVKKMIA
jgi:ADP-heptose:LPS heptosyltransferase